jgi:hypothetical protein
VKSPEWASPIRTRLKVTGRREEGWGVPMNRFRVFLWVLVRSIIQGWQCLLFSVQWMHSCTDLDTFNDSNCDSKCENCNSTKIQFTKEVENEDAYRLKGNDKCSDIGEDPEGRRRKRAGQKKIGKKDWLGTCQIWQKTEARNN